MVKSYEQDARLGATRSRPRIYIPFDLNGSSAPSYKHMKKALPREYHHYWAILPDFSFASRHRRVGTQRLFDAEVWNPE